MVGKEGLFELKKCTVSGLERQFDKWHLFSAPTGGGGLSGEGGRGRGREGVCGEFGGGGLNIFFRARNSQGFM